MSDHNTKMFAEKLLDLTYGEMLSLETFVRTELGCVAAAIPREHTIANALDQWARTRVDGVRAPKPAKVTLESVK